jgi:DNA replication and repair protein RecF
VRLSKLRIANVRCLASVDLELEGGVSLFLGGNGAGKTSVLEAVHLLGYGRSFRGRVRDGLIRTGQGQLEVFAEAEDGQGRLRRIGLQHSGQRWQARLDGSDVATLGELCAQVPVVTFEPGSHALIAGGSDNRRRFLDWGLFHVEPEFLSLWRRYTRALKQRNAALKLRAPGQLPAWDRELAEAGEPLTRIRQGYLEHWRSHLGKVAGEFLGELGPADVDFQPGWRRQELPLADALLLARERDLQLGATTVGPHRADWQLQFAALPGREALSRGQEKLAALACVLAQAEDHAQRCGDWPVVCLDDLGSELDAEHQARVLQRILRNRAQVLLTGTEAPAGLSASAGANATFHVERGHVRRRRPA